MERPAEDGFVRHDHIDPTALDELLADSSGDGTMAVSVEIDAENTYSIVVDDASQISIQYDHTSSAEPIADRSVYSRLLT